MKITLTIVAGLFVTARILAIFTGLDSMNSPTKHGTTEQEARDLWEKMIAAKGGHDRLSQVRNVHISCRALRPDPRRGYQGLGAHYEKLYVFPDRIWGWNDDRPSAFGLQLVTHNGERNVTWRLTDDNPSHPTQFVANDTDRYSSVQIQLIYFLETRWVKPVPVSARQGTLAGKQVDVIHTIWNKFKADYYLDRNTHLPVKVTIYGISSIDGAERDFGSFAVGEYVSVNGIQMPTRKGSFDADTPDPSILCSTEINVDYDETIFDHAPRIEDGPEAWRPRRKP